jgi:hypothetical protein
MSERIGVHIVFSQDPARLPSFERLAAQADKFFGATLELVERSASRLAVKVVAKDQAYESVLCLDAREISREDLIAAREAEAHGRAAGMGDLAARCKFVWELGGAAADPRAMLTFCAVCASVGLGPVMPPDRSTLFGVRGAIERRDRA